MAVDDVKKFYEAMSKDKEMQQKFMDIFQKYQESPMDEGRAVEIMNQEVLPLAQHMGYSFSMDDLKAYGEKMMQKYGNCELSEEEMQSVAGGAILGVDFFCIIGGGGSGVVCVFLGLNDWVGTQKPKFCFLVGLGD